MATKQTYRDATTGNIYSYDTLTGNKEYLGPNAYKAKVSTGEVSGSPMDISKMPTIKRDGAGYEVSQTSQPVTGRTLNVGDPGSYDTLRQAVSKIVGMKNAQNKDLTESEAYWTKYGMETGNQFTDPRFNLMSPEEQSAINTSRMATANANLSALAKERQTREDLSGTALDRVSTINTELINAEERRRRDALDARELSTKERQNAINEIKDKIELGIPVTDSDWNKIGVESSAGRTGGSLSWRNSNPGNLKFSTWQEQYGAVKDPNSAFARFPDENSAREAYKALLTSPTGIYRGLDNNEAMLKWSSDYEGDPRAYSYDKLVKLGAPAVSKPFSKFTDQEWNQFFEAQKKAEGWTEGINLAQGTSKNTWTDTQLKDLAKRSINAGLIYTADELKKMSDNDLQSIEAEITKTNSASNRLSNSQEGIRIQAKYNIDPETVGVIIDNILKQGGDSNAMTKVKTMLEADPATKPSAGAVDEIFLMLQPK